MPKPDRPDAEIQGQPIRMERLASLPVFLNLQGKRAVLAGGTLPSVWKAELLSASGAAVRVLAASPCRELVALAAAPPRGSIVLVARRWRASDLVGAAVAVGAIEEETEAQAFRDAARAAGVPVNVIDKPAFCDFQFGTIVSRSPLVIGIATDGAAPVFGQAIRARIEALLPQGLRQWTRAAKDWRPTVQALDFRARRRFWEVFTDRAFAAPDAEPTAADLDACQAAALDEQVRAPQSGVTLVAAGTGDPDDLTLKAIRALQSADTVVYDPDLSATMVGFARREAVKIPITLALGAEIPREIDALLQPGRRIAWLDRGDPLHCLRWQARAQELDARSVILACVAGLGLCPDCTPDCPSWPRHKP